MTERQFWIGSSGPFYYDDAEQQVPVAEATEDSLADSTLKHALRTEGQVLVGTAPSLATHVLRLEDLDGEFQQIACNTLLDPIELNSLSADVVGGLLIAYTTSSNINEYTLYAWDSASAVAENPPYTVDGAGGGKWVAIGGKYSNAAISVPPGVALYISSLAYFIYQNNRLELFVNGTLQATWP